ncbi:hypothetical protein LG943_06410 [Streptomonospora sp. S1-112]|uniref:Uncharacterized protein n=1 Tax=Streptomonospora mangrovi TaxID=2883123 RepID=A0A9X3NHN1_9ACTN|nr:hypothetical protein [Streptomonospora mangrovi]MDA0563959.1 hypothetical protein [Streptomonospora mangrovi]
MDNVERGRAVHGPRVAVPAGDDGHALLWFAYCPNCQAMVNADRGFLADCWRCAKPLPRKFNSRSEIRVEWVPVEEATSGERSVETCHCVYCGTATFIATRTCPTCRRPTHPEPSTSPSAPPTASSDPPSPKPPPSRPAPP